MRLVIYCDTQNVTYCCAPALNNHTSCMSNKKITNNKIFVTLHLNIMILQVAIKHEAIIVKWEFSLKLSVTELQVLNENNTHIL